MNLNFEFAQIAIANTEAVTYTSVSNAGNNTVSVADAAFYRTGGLAEGSPSQGVYVKSTARFAIRNSLIGSVGPKPADIITRADGSVWTVLKVSPPVISGVYQLDTIDLILSNGLVQSGSLTRPSNAEQDAAGRQKLATYTTIAAGIPCRLQPVGGDATDATQRRTMIQRFTAILGQQIIAQALDVFTVGSQSYTVLDFKLPQRIDELMTLSLELIDAGSSSPSGGPAFSVQPAISGTPIVGNTLTCSPGTASQSPTFAYQWLSGGVAITGATSAAYVLQSSDLGNLMACNVTATSGGVGTLATAAPVGPVTNGSGLTGTFP